jgi:S-adenosylmethionine synthetase
MFLFTSEDVSSGHPDKICDQISDAVLDEALKQDPNSRVAIETAVKTGMTLVFGEMRTKGWIDIERIARQVIRDIGYTKSEFGFDSESVAILSSIGKQSTDISVGVDETETHELGAGDQGMMFGYACQETEEYMPLPIILARKVIHTLEHVRKNEGAHFLRPDAKAQVTVEYDEKNIPSRVHTVVLSTQHSPDISLPDLQKKMYDMVLFPSLGELVDEETIYHINPTGTFVTGGPQGDAGLTGRKIIVDTYGGSCPHGGGAFSGKDPTKVDRTGAYAARHIAKNIVASRLAKKCQVQISYAIGIAKPISICVETFGTGRKRNHEIEEIVQKYWDLRPAKIILAFDLKKPIYQKTATGGHFGRAIFPWEKLDKKEVLQKEI